MLREEHDPTSTYGPMLRQLVRLGVREADLFLLPKPVELVGARSVALSDTIFPIGALRATRCR